MSCDDLIAVVPADPDSHFRLRKCRKCGGDHTAYVQKTHGKWAVRCFDCGNEGREADCRHGAQGMWNGGQRNG